MKILLILAATGLVILAAAMWTLERRLPSIIQARAAGAIGERYQGKVNFGRFSVSLFPRIRISGEDLQFRHKGRTDVPPLITVQSFSAEAGIVAFFTLPIHVKAVRLDRLVITVPPKSSSQNEAAELEKPMEQPGKALVNHYPVVVDQLTCANAELRILPRDTKKEPLVFSIHKLDMHNAGLGRSAPFHATLTNPAPRGFIETDGRFGPWQRDDPGQTPVSGQYSFEHADLATFHGLSGILSSTGEYRGVLDRIIADGETDTPDFKLSISAHPMALHTRYHAIIDGTNGDTELRPVIAHFLQSTVEANGSVANIPGQKGKTISLDAVTHGRLEDLLLLALKGDRSPMTGAIQFHTKIVLPPGANDVARRLQLAGRFATTSTAFTKEAVQDKLKNLSRHAEGKPNDPNAGSEIFDLAGNFRLRDGVAAFSGLNFAVSGAQVRLQGTYGLLTEQIAFSGTLRMKAKVSQTTTGFKSLVLKLVDPFFAKDGAGAVLPIKITGTREQPSFGLAFGAAREEATAPGTNSRSDPSR